MGAALIEQSEGASEAPFCGFHSGKPRLHHGNVAGGLLGSGGDAVSLREP